MTLLDLLDDAARLAPDERIVHLRSDGGEDVQTYAALDREARAVGAGLSALELERGAPVLVLCDRGDDFVRAFWGALRAGLVPVPLAPDPEKLLSVFAALTSRDGRRPPIVVCDDLAPLLEAGAAQMGMSARVLRTSALAASDADASALDAIARPRPDDVAYLQFSSGSTASPKGVEITHANVLANVEQLRVSCGIREGDVVVSWMPYFHDMGLVGTHLMPLACRFRQVKMGPLDFVRDPAAWLAAAHRHRATLLSAASFALGLIARRVPDEALDALDLSTVRMLGVGAEPISARAVRAFSEKLARARLDPRAVVPVYGLAEATLAVSCPPLGELPRVWRLDRAALAEGRAIEVGEADGDATELLDLGVAVQGTEIRIVDDARAPVADGVVGQIEVRGPQVARGYVGAPEATREAFGADGWLRTFDVGFLRDGRLCATGRAKDIVFVNGRKLHAHDLEELVAQTPGAPSGRTVVVGVSDEASGADRIGVFVPWKDAPESIAGVLREIVATVRRASGHDDVRVVPIAPRDIPRTTSGKLQRGTLRASWVSGAFAAREEEAAKAIAALPPMAVAARARLASRRESIEVSVRATFARVLGVGEDAIDRDASFRELGGSSLKAMEVVAELERAHSIRIAPAALRTRATVAEIAAYVDEQLAARGDGSRDEVRTPEAIEARPRVAIVGMACRFPDADTPERFWENLLAGRDSVRTVPEGRWPDAAPDDYAHGSFLSDVDGFDAGFFGIDGEEARFTDPHARIFLEVAHEALERAGYAGPRRRGLRVGVFTAIGESAFSEMLTRWSISSGSALPTPSLVGNLRSLIAARVAQHLDLIGPAMVVDTACSSVLVALHLARRSLEARECDVALVGGVSLSLSPTAFRLLAGVQALSPSGRSRAFSGDADGFVPGEGAGAIVLARERDALARGDVPLAIVRGSAINNDGRSISLMAPSPRMQQEVIADALRDADLEADAIGYVEAHGTGTPIGDPIEARSLAHALPPRRDGRPRLLGSVKTNLGHLLNTAGIPSLIKVVLALRHRVIPPTLHRGAPSQRFDLAAAGLEVVTEARPWADAVLRAGVNGFGFGGTNAHVVLEEASPTPEVRAPREPVHRLLTVSAASESALRASVDALARTLRARPDLDEGDVCATASSARDDREHRVAVVACGDLAERLETLEISPSDVRGRPRIALLFSGQGAQVRGRGASLLASAPELRERFARLAAAAGSIEGRSLEGWLRGDGADAASLARTSVAQPLLVAFEIALARQLLAWGIAPDAVAGHSAGELAAAAIAGLLDDEEAVLLARDRGEAMQRLGTVSAMAAVSAEASVVRSIVDGEIAIVADNAPAQVAIAGSIEAIERAMRALGARRIAATRLAVSHAFHTPAVARAIDALGPQLAAIGRRTPTLPIASTATAGWLASIDGAHFRAHALGPVRFRETVARLLAEGIDTFVEVGPGATLVGLARATARATPSSAATGVEVIAIPLLAHGEDETRSLLGAIGRLWVRGATLDRRALDADCARVEVPTYPFEHTAYPAPRASAGARAVVTSVPRDPRDPILAEHRILDEPVLPAAAIFDLALRAAGGERDAAIGLGDVSLLARVRGDCEVRLEDDGRRWSVWAEGAIAARGAVLGGAAVSEVRPLIELRARCAIPFDPARLYDALSARGMVHGPPYRRLVAIEIGSGEALGTLGGEDDPRAHAIDPTLLDAAMQVVAAPLLDETGGDDSLYVPFGVASLRRGHGGAPRYAHARLITTVVPRAPEVVRCDVDVLDAEGRVVIRAEGFALKRVHVAAKIARVAWVPERGASGAMPQRIAIAAHGELGEMLAGAIVARVGADAGEVERGSWAELARLADGADAVVAIVPVGGEDDRAIDALLCPLVELARAAPRARIALVTRGAFAADGRPGPPSHAMVAGLVRGMADEGLDARVIDLPLDASPDDARAILQELALDDGRAAVRWARGERRVATLVDATMPGECGAAPGVVIVTGGARGIGTLVAQRLSRMGARAIVLSGRAESAPEALLDELRDRGADVSYVRADVSDEVDVEGLIAGTVARHGRIDLLVHAAGIARAGSLGAKELADFREVLAPKVRGALLLRSALGRHAQRPRVIYFSSIAPLVPGLAGGLADYAAANGFLDGLAALARAEGEDVTSIAWGPWRDEGMATSQALRASLEARGVRPLSARAALAAFELVLRGADAHVVVGDGLVLAPGSSRPTRREGTVSDAADAPDLASFVRALVASALRRPISEIRTDASFLGMGLDSLTAVDLVRKVERRVGRTLSTTLFFEHATIDALAAHLDGGTITSAPRAPRIAPPEEARDDGEPFALSPVQRAFWANDRLHPEITAYSFLRQTIEGALDERLLARALSALEARHPMLRAVFDTDARGTPRQRIAPARATERPSWLRSRVLDRTIEELETETCNGRFDLERGPLVRAVLAREPRAGGPDRTHLLLVVHHVVCDGYSLAVLTDELWSLYRAGLRAEETAPSPIVAGRFRDAIAAIEPERAARLPGERAFWAERLAAVEELALPWDGEVDAPPTPPLVAHARSLDAESSQALRALAARAGVSLFHVLLAIHARCLSRWSGSPRVTIAVARARRDPRMPGIERMVGCFADTLPVTIVVRHGEAIPGLAARVRDAWLEIERHDAATSMDLARWSDELRRDSSRPEAPRTTTPATFSLARFPVLPYPDLPVSVVDAAGGTASAATRLGLACWEMEGALRFTWTRPAALLSEASIARLAREHLDAIAEALEEGTRSSTAAITGTHDEDGRAAREPAESPCATDIVARFAARASATPDAIAVDGERGAISYGALARAAAGVAGALRARAIGPGAHVALLASPSADAVAGILGILASGAAWVPLDPTWPRARIDDVLAQSQCRALVLDGADGDAARVDERIPRIEVRHVSAGKLSTLADPAPPEATAYVIFTSGSTGRPKGVPISRAALARYLAWACAAFELDASDRMAATASIAFDASIRQLLAPLLAGATAVPAPRDVVRDPDALLEWIARERLTIWSSVPTLWERTLSAAEARASAARPLPDLSRLRWILLGGEALMAAPVRRWIDRFGTRARLANLYGPTETTINAAYHVVPARPSDDAQRIPIGRAIDARTLTVVDVTGRACEPGVPGELVVGGLGVTAGYLGRPELDADAFVVRDGARAYRTGDRVVLRSDGALEFLGRLDDQVKIRGHRIEPGEVEAHLAAHAGVSRAAVLAEPGPEGAPRLVAWIERAASAALDGAALRAHLELRVPEAMLPARFVLVEALPTNSAGKIDRAALRALGPSAAEPRPELTSQRTDDDDAPSTPTELAIARAWTEVLEIAPPRRDDDFFALGGDSIAILSVFSRLASRFPALPRPTIAYRHRTLAALARAIDEAASSHTPRDARADAADTSEPFPLTPAQRGFLLAEALAPDARQSWVASFTLDGPLDPERLQRALDRLVERHAMLRVELLTSARPPLQRELPVGRTIPIAYEPDATPERVAACFDEERAHAIDPAGWPLVRLRLLRLRSQPRRHTLIVHAHHLVGDGLSAALLTRELLALDDGLRRGAEPDLPPLRASFREWVSRIAEHDARAGETSEAFFRARFAAPYDPPRLRGSTEPPVRRDERTSSPRADRALDAHTFDALRALARRESTTPFAVVLTAIARALGTRLERRDLVLGIALSGRDALGPDGAHVFGPFATALPIRLRLEGAAFTGDLRATDAEVGASRAHAISPDRIARAVGGAASVALGAQFFVTYLDFDSLAPLPLTSELTLRVDESRTDMTPPPAGTDLVVAARPIDGALRITLRSAREALDERALEALADAIIGELQAAPLADASTAELQAAPLATATIAAPRSAPGELRGSITTAAECSLPGLGIASTAALTLDAALVGYLPPIAHIAAIAGLGALDLETLRARVRATVFPDSRPRMLETIDTPLGRSAFVCLPRFADELMPSIADALARQSADAVRLAARGGARCVSLAGMIPSLTGYGMAVQRALGADAPALTTGHAATAVSVVLTALSALAGRAVHTLAIVGAGSIGRASLMLLLTRLSPAPSRLILCDVAGVRERLDALIADARATGWSGEVLALAADERSPDAIYEADLVIAATSTPAVLDPDRLRPGAIVVDDSFPPALDTARAIARMRTVGDVIITGGGLLECGRAERRALVELAPALAPPPDLASRIASQRPAATIASCQLESLLCAHDASLPRVLGLVTPALAARYWDAIERAGIRAGPLHLGDFLVAKSTR